MVVSYEKYRKFLREKHLTSRSLGKELPIASSTMTRRRRDVEVSLSLPGKICRAWDVNFWDLADYLKEREEENEWPIYRRKNAGVCSLSLRR